MDARTVCGDDRTVYPVRASKRSGVFVSLYVYQLITLELNDPHLKDLARWFTLTL